MDESPLDVHGTRDGRALESRMPPTHEEPRTLTNEEIAVVASALQDQMRAGTDRPFVSTRLALALVDEIRRLRSDDWLERAVEDVGQASDPLDEMLAILRQHRDGR